MGNIDLSTGLLTFGWRVSPTEKKNVLVPLAIWSKWFVSIRLLDYQNYFNTNYRCCSISSNFVYFKMVSLNLGIFYALYSIVSLLSWINFSSSYCIAEPIEAFRNFPTICGIESKCVREETSSTTCPNVPLAFNISKWSPSGEVTFRVPLDEYIYLSLASFPSTFIAIFKPFH